MGSINFVSNANFPNYGDGGVSGFSIDIVQECLPYTFYVRVVGIQATYAYVLRDVDENIICSGNIVHDGSGGGDNNNEYEICGGDLEVGNFYTLTVTKNSKSEKLTFDVMDCGVLYPLQASYNCYTGLEIVCEGVCASADIIKIEDATETISLPIEGQVFLENGFYTIEVGDNSVEIEVSCNIELDTYYTTCNEPGVPNLTVLLNNVITGEDYNIIIETTDEVPAVVYERTLTVEGIPSVSGTVLNNVGLIINDFDTPPIDESTSYAITIEHTSLNDKSYLGTFNAAIVDVTDTLETADCTTNTFIGFPIDVEVTNISCTSEGFTFVIGAGNDTNIPQVDLTIADSNEVGVYTERFIFGGSNNSRTIEVPFSAFGGCIDSDFIIFFTVKGTDGSDITWYNLRVDSGLISGTLGDCTWAENCLIA